MAETWGGEEGRKDIEKMVDLLEGAVAIVGRKERLTDDERKKYLTECDDAINRAWNRGI